MSTIRGSIPLLAEKLAEGQPFRSIGPGGTSTGYLKDGGFVTRSHKLEDGSLIQDTSKAVQSIRRILERANYDEESIAESLARFESAPENRPVILPEGLTVTKWSIERIEPVFDGPQIAPLLSIKIAYEFLALHLGRNVYETSPCLSAARRALTDAEIDPTHLSVDPLYAATAKPFHGIAFEGNFPHAKVQIRLFGKLAFRVHFKSLSVGGPRFAYTHDLEADKEHLSQIREQNESV